MGNILLKKHPCNQEEGSCFGTLSRPSQHIRTGRKKYRR